MYPTAVSYKDGKRFFSSEKLICYTGIRSFSPGRDRHGPCLKIVVNDEYRSLHTKTDVMSDQDDVMALF